MTGLVRRTQRTHQKAVNITVLVYYKERIWIKIRQGVESLGRLHNHGILSAKELIQTSVLGLLGLHYIDNVIDSVIDCLSGCTQYPAPNPPGLPNIMWPERPTMSQLISINCQVWPRRPSSFHLGNFKGLEVILPRSEEQRPDLSG